MCTLNFAMLLTLAMTLVGTPGLAAIAPGPFGSKSNLLATPPIRSEAALTAPKAPAQPLVFSCADLRRTALNMSAHASNLANRNTTRSADGGPYKRMDVVCKAAGGAFCDIEKVEASRIVHEPGHPDADADGNVKMPDINLSGESSALISSATELKVMALQGACGSRALEQGPITVVRYHEDFEVMMDTMTFAADGRITRWARTTRDGKTQNLSFKDDGSPVGL